MPRLLVASVGVLLLAAMGCGLVDLNQISWSSVDGKSQQQAAQDLYDCMKENTSYQHSENAGSGGYSSSSGQEVNRELVIGCMQARGYSQAGKLPKAK